MNRAPTKIPQREALAEAMQAIRQSSGGDYGSVQLVAKYDPTTDNLNIGYLVTVTQPGLVLNIVGAFVMTSEQATIKGDSVFLDYTVPNLTCSGIISDFGFAAIYGGQQLTVVAGAALCDANGSNYQSISAQTTVTIS
jgi:hypothetical protein